MSQEGPYLFRLFNDNLWTDLSRIYLHLELRIERYNDVDNVWEPLDANDTHLAPNDTHLAPSLNEHSALALNSALNIFSIPPTNASLRVPSFEKFFL